MMAVLFMIGKGLEEPTIVTQLINLTENEGRPTYLMAPELPLCLVHCEYSENLQWITETMPDVRRGFPYLMISY